MGGVLVAPAVIMTAAHCFDRPEYEGSLSFVVGGVGIPIKRVVRHPAYVSTIRGSSNDATLAEMYRAKLRIHDLAYAVLARPSDVKPSAVANGALGCSYTMASTSEIGDQTIAEACIDHALALPSSPTPDAIFEVSAKGAAHCEASDEGMPLFATEARGDTTASLVAIYVGSINPVKCNPNMDFLRGYESISGHEDFYDEAMRAR